MEIVGLVLLSLIGAFLVSLLFLNIPQIKNNTASGLFPVVFIFVLSFIVFGLMVYYSMGDLGGKTQAVEEKHSTSSIKKDLNSNSEKWINSFDDSEFSTYELYLLNEVQDKTKVKVYETALKLQDTVNPSNEELFKKLLFKAKSDLNSK